MSVSKKPVQLATLLRRLAKLASKPLDQATAMEPAVYTSSELLKLEREKIFQTEWICVGRGASIPKVGDYLCDDLVGQPVVVIRQKTGELAAFANVCRHRMMTLLEGSGNKRKITCPYHAWSYALDGQLVAAPYMEQSAGFDKKKVCLPSVRCEQWQGWIYLTLNSAAPSVAKLLAGLEPLVAPYAMEHYVPIDQQDHVWETNWKQLTENFMEGYHLPVAHRATVGGYFPVDDTRFEEGAPDPAYTYQFFTKTAGAPVGIAHKNNTSLIGEQRRTSILPTIFPSHMIALAPDHLWYLALQPLDTGKVKIRYGAALAPEVLAASKNPKKLIKDTCAFLDKVNEEDRLVVEGIFRGASAPLSEPGQLSWLERENHEFTQYLSRKLTNKSR